MIVNFIWALVPVSLSVALIDVILVPIVAFCEKTSNVMVNYWHLVLGTPVFNMAGFPHWHMRLICCTTLFFVRHTIARCYSTKRILNKYCSFDSLIYRWSARKLCSFDHHTHLSKPVYLSSFICYFISMLLSNQCKYNIIKCEWKKLNSTELNSVYSNVVYRILSLFTSFVIF